DKTEHVGNDVLKRKIILYFSSVYPITVNLMSMRHFLKKWDLYSQMIKSIKFFKYCLMRV
ncbi:MAG: hypothetical protein ACXQS3_01870, partial [Candidatus Methanofastidiosia archaeon]